MKIKKIINGILLGSFIASTNLYAFDYNKNNISFLKIKKIKFLSSNINTIYLYSLNNFKNYGGNAYEKIEDNIFILNKETLKNIYNLHDNIFNNIFNKGQFTFKLIKDSNNNYYFQIVNLNLKNFEFNDLKKYLLNWNFENNSIKIPLPVFYNKIIKFNNSIKEQISIKPPKFTDKIWYQPNKLNGFNLYTFKNNKWNRIGYIIFDTTNFKIKYDIVLPDEKESLKLPKNFVFDNIKVKVNNNYYINYTFDKYNKEWVKEDTKKSEFKGETSLEGLINDLYNSENGTIFYVTSKFWNGTKIFKKTIISNGKNVWVDKTNNIFIFDNVVDMLKSKLRSKINIVKDLYDNKIYYGYYNDLINKSNLHLTVSDYRDFNDIDSNDLKFIKLYDVNNGWVLKKYNNLFYNDDKSVILSLENRYNTRLINGLKSNAKVYMKKNDCNNNNCYDYPYVQKEGNFYIFYYVPNTYKIKNVNHLSNIPVYNNIIEGYNSNVDKFLYSGKNINGGIKSFSILSKITKDNQTFYQDQMGRIINLQGLFFPLSFVPKNVSPDNPIVSIMGNNFLVFDHLEDIVLNIDTPKNETIYINNINKYLYKCNNTDTYTIWADNCFKPNFQVTNDNRTKLIKNNNFNSINLTYKNLPSNTLHYGGIKFDKNDKFFQWYWIDRIYKDWQTKENKPISNYIINNFIDSYYINDSFGNESFDDTVIQKINDFTPEEFYIDNKHLLGNIENLKLNKFLKINSTLGLPDYKLPDKEFWYKDNTVIEVPIAFKNKVDKEIYGNNIQVKFNPFITVKKDFDNQSITFTGSNRIKFFGNFVISLKKKTSYPTNILIARFLQANNISKIILLNNNKVLYDEKTSSRDFKDNVGINEDFKLTENLMNEKFETLNIKVYFKPNFKLVLGQYFFIPKVDNNDNVIMNENFKAINLYNADKDKLVFMDLLNTTPKDFGNFIWYKKGN